jgi:hypothetical protein
LLALVAENLAHALAHHVAALALKFGDPIFLLHGQAQVRLHFGALQQAHRVALQGRGVAAAARPAEATSKARSAASETLRVGLAGGRAEHGKREGSRHGQRNGSPSCPKSIVSVHLPTSGRYGCFTGLGEPCEAPVRGRETCRKDPNRCCVVVASLSAPLDDARGHRVHWRGPASG